MRETHIARWARDARKAAGYSSAAKAAAEAGVPVNWLHLVESSHIGKPDPERIAALARIYGSEPPEPDDATPQTLEEVRIAELMFEAYQRGVEYGRRLRYEGPAGPQQ